MLSKRLSHVCHAQQRYRSFTELFMRCCTNGLNSIRKFRKCYFTFETISPESRENEWTEPTKTEASLISLMASSGCTEPLNVIKTKSLTFQPGLRSKLNNLNCFRRTYFLRLDRNWHCLELTWGRGGLSKGMRWVTSQNANGRAGGLYHFIRFEILAEPLDLCF